MHIPKIPNPIPWDILPFLEYLNFTLGEFLDVINLLGGLGKSKLKQFTLACPYPTSKGNRATLAKFFGDPGLYDSVNPFSRRPRRSGTALTWEFVTTFNPFANMQALNLNAPCGLTCHFKFPHEHVIKLSRWMPRLRVLCFGGSPCTSGGLTFNNRYQAPYARRTRQELSEPILARGPLQYFRN